MAPGCESWPESPAALGAIDLFSRLDRGSTDTAIGDPERVEAVVAQIRDGLMGTLSTASAVHGLQAELMFEGLVASLGSCLLVKKEDAGDCYFTGDQLKLPDYRIVLANGRSLLVEVKSHGKDSMSAFRIGVGEMEGLNRYAALIGGADLRLGIYWARANLWTLVDPKFFTVEGSKYVISITDAMMHNEMAALGDLMVSTRHPLSLTLLADLTEDHSVDEHGEANLTIGGVELRCRGTLLELEVEKSLAMFFMLNGSWAGSESAHVEGGELMSVTFEMVPEEPVDGQVHQSLGWLSSLFSSWFRSVTMPGTEVRRLGSEVDPGSLGQMIPTDYASEALPLWRFHIQPKHHEDC